MLQKQRSGELESMKTAVLATLSQRRSIRSFKMRRVPRKIVNQIILSAQRAPTACGMQTYSFIYITDKELRRQVSKAIGQQECMRQAPVWIIVCADMARQLKLFRFLGVRTRFGPLSMLLPAVIDASLAAENMIIAAEAFGLGSVCIGSIWGNLKQVAKILNLPKKVLPVVLICLGYPNETPPTRPRWPIKAVLHDDRYNMPSNELMEEYYVEANRQLIEMRYFKDGVHNWAEHWQKKFPSNEMKKWEKRMREDLKDLGLMP